MNTQTYLIILMLLQSTLFAQEVLTKVVSFEDSTSIVQDFFFGKSLQPIPVFAKYADSRSISDNSVFATEFRQRIGTRKTNDFANSFEANELILFSDSIRVVTRSFRKQGLENKTFSSIKSYLRKDRGYLKIKEFQTISGAIYPNRVECMDDVEGIILSTDATEGPGESTLQVFDASLERQYTYRPFDRQYQRSSYAKIPGYLIFNFFEDPGSQESSTKIAFFDTERFEVTKEIELPRQGDRIINLFFTTEHILVSYLILQNGRAEYRFAKFSHSGAEIWDRAYGFPVNQIQVSGNSIYCRGTDLDIWKLDLETGLSNTKLDLRDHYPFTANNERDFLVSFSDFQIHNNSDNRYLIFTIPTLANKAGFSGVALIFYDIIDDSVIDTVGLKEASANLVFKHVDKRADALLYNNKIYLFSYGK